MHIPDPRDEGRDAPTPEVPSKLPQSRGGLARAAKLSPAQRTEIARRAAESRWKGEMPYATHDGPMMLAGREVIGAVLNTRMRVLTQESFLVGIGRNPKAKGGQGGYKSRPEGDGEIVDDLPPFLAANNLKGFIDDDLRSSTTPVLYRSKSGKTTFGYDARLLPRVCDVYIRAGLAGKLTSQQKPIADTCRRIQADFGEYGIYAMVDKATGYTDDLATNELVKLLDAYIDPILLPYAPLFPAEFFQQIYRLHGWEYKPGVTAGPRYIGKFIMEYVWSGIPKDVVDEIKRRNPSNDKGQRRRKLFQFLTDETGIPHLDWLISQVTMLMRVSIDKEQFKDLYARAFQKRIQSQMMLPHVSERRVLPQRRKALPSP